MSRLLETVEGAFGKLRGKLTALPSDQRGASALEFAIFAGILAFAVLNTADISIYIYKRMQLENATEMAVQAAWKACDPSLGYLPATTSCPNLTTTITQAAQSTTLGPQVTIQGGSPVEGYYCLNSSGALQYVAAATSNPPSDCSSTGVPDMTPADYIQITTTYSYVPLFPGVTVAGVFTTPITKTGMMRLN
ncbi:MAG TPA: TadE/TadG family type IV pilus assembly protein [Candidatus Paceibacterota bacterium]